MKKLIILIFILIAVNINAQDSLKFNDTKLTLVEKQNYKNSKLYVDDKGNNYLNLTLMLTEDGILIGEKQTPLGDWILFPTDKVNLTKQDIEDIFIFLKGRDLKNRIK